MTGRLAEAPLALQLLLLVGLVARVTILVVDDRITMAPRRWVQGHVATGGYAEYLTWCAACVSVHTAWIATACWLTWPGPTLTVAAAATAALVGAVIVGAVAHPVPPQPDVQA